MRYDPLRFFVISLLGLSIVFILSFSDESSAILFSHILANACDDSDAVVQLSGMLAGITFCFSALFLYSWVADYNDMRDNWNFFMKLFGYNAVIGLVGLTWFSSGSNFNSFHRIISGWAVSFMTLFALLNWLRYWTMWGMKTQQWRLFLKGVFGLSCAFSTIMMAVFFFMDNEVPFAIFQGLFWILFTFSFAVEFDADLLMMSILSRSSNKNSNVIFSYYQK